MHASFGCECVYKQMHESMTTNMLIGFLSDDEIKVIFKTFFLQILHILRFFNKHIIFF